ncbi:MAG: endopeptidase La [Alphaproteobacteria bacterium]|nr:endopeptidase La [Alphaproteobacteria bacterium]NCQ66516.1 endopeptidase La [Alphaproteobacteria bacterium]NCT08307.1 endopeptidase La [Alphaproteobacteria bacterium]
MAKNLELPTKNSLPVLPLRDIVVFPNMIVPLFVGREKSVNALEEVMLKDQRVLLVTQKDPALEEPKGKDLYTMGTVAQVLQLLKLPDGTVKVLVEGEQRAHVFKLSKKEGYFVADVEIIKPDVDEVNPEAEAHMRNAINVFEQYLKLNPKIPPESLASVAKIDEPHQLADTLASHLTIKVVDKQKVLEIINVTERLEAICAFMETEISVMQAEKRIRGRVKTQMEKSQREYYLNEQMKAIQKELGEDGDILSDAEEFEKKLKGVKLSKEAREKVKAELKKFKAMNPMASEATVVRNYLDWVLSLPWNKPSKVKKDIVVAQEVLDEDHYGLTTVKERIVEYLAVQSRVGKVKGPILCLVGPPGVGKTSLGESIARATGRKFVRMALGGVRDESEIRGHRRTYIGAMPGKIVQGMKKAGSSNPLFLLDEIDKMGSDWRGDPASALLEVLDPEQNTAFNDHYLEVDYDLSDVMFVTTANSLDMPQPLLDRMEIIRLSGYTEDEKVQIALRYLIPKQMERHGLADKEWSISENALRDILRHYTREAGVRNLEREISKLLRKAIKEILTTKSKKTIKITERNLQTYLGVPRFKYGVSETKDMVGTTTGLAWTEAGGDILFVEAVMLPGKGKMIITGKLGEVMQESVQAAASYIRSRSTDFGIIPPVFEKNDIHIHVPEGATPKDGPSAGVTMCTSIVSMLTGIPVKRDVAMTGEITLRGRVLPIGGLKEKLLAAHRGGIKTVLIPKDNEKDLTEIPEKIKAGLKIIPVATVEEVLANALVRKPKSVVWTPPKPSSKKDHARGDETRAH